MAATGQAAGGDGGQAQGEGQAQQGGDFSQIQGILETQGQSLEEMRNFLASNPWQQQTLEGEGEQGGEFDLSTLDQLYDQEQSQAVQAFTQQAIQQAVTPLQQMMAAQQKQLTDERHLREATAIGDRFPELADPVMAKKIAAPGGLAEQRAQEFEHRLGIPGLAARLAAEPAWWEDTYMKHKAAEAANQEGSGDPGAASLESGGGAGPAPFNEADYVKAIRNAGGGAGKQALDRM